MTVEKKIYAPWAYLENEFEKRDMNIAIYEELKAKYKIADSFNALGHESEYDLIYSSESCYGHTVYTIIKNTTELTDEELALIFDRGNLCFGFSTIGGHITVFTD
mgnify:CR=1 FL=1